MTEATASQLIAACSGIVGTMLGGVLGWFATWTLEKRRWAREDRNRFTGERRKHYADLASASTRFAGLASSSTDRVSPFVDMFNAYFGVLHIGDAEVIPAAYQLFTTAQEFLHPGEDTTEIADRFTSDLNSFNRAVRDAHGLVLPEGIWLR